MLPFGEGAMKVLTASLPIVLLATSAGANNPLIEQVPCPDVPRQEIMEIAQQCSQATDVCGDECIVPAIAAGLSGLDPGVRFPCEAAKPEDFTAWASQCLADFVPLLQENDVDIQRASHPLPFAIQSVLSPSNAFRFVPPTRRGGGMRFSLHFRIPLRRSNPVQGRSAHS